MKERRTPLSDFGNAFAALLQNLKASKCRVASAMKGLDNVQLQDTEAKASFVREVRLLDQSKMALVLEIDGIKYACCWRRHFQPRACVMALFSFG